MGCGMCGPSTQKPVKSTSIRSRLRLGQTLMKMKSNTKKKRRSKESLEDIKLKEIIKSNWKKIPNEERPDEYKDKPIYYAADTLTPLSWAEANTWPEPKPGAVIPNAWLEEIKLEPLPQFKAKINKKILKDLESLMNYEYKKEDK
jgi:hypothetical protein